jgi:hypothetical protein
VSKPVPVGIAPDEGVVEGLAQSAANAYATAIGAAFVGHATGPGWQAVARFVLEREAELIRKAARFLDDDAEEWLDRAAYSAEPEIYKARAQRQRAFANRIRALGRGEGGDDD